MNGVYQLSTGKELVSCKYDNALDFSEGLALVQLNNKYGIIDKNGKEICPYKYDYALGFSEGLAQVRLNEKWGLINYQGIEVVPLIFNNIWRFRAATIVKLGNKYGLVNNNGEYILPCEYDEINMFHERIIAEKSDTKYEFNLFGELIKILNDTDLSIYFSFFNCEV